MKRFACAVSMVLGLILFSAVKANATTYFYSGYACLPENNTYSFQLNSISGGANGIENTSTTTPLDLSCPVTAITATTGAAILDYRVDYKDSNATTSGDVTCTFVGRPTGGSLFVSSSLSSCSTAGGCTTGGTTFTGTGFLSWTAPIGGTSLVSMYADCSVPVKTTATSSVISHRISY